MWLVDDEPLDLDLVSCIEMTCPQLNSPIHPDFNIQEATESGRSIYFALDNAICRSTRDAPAAPHRIFQVRDDSRIRAFRVLQPESVPADRVTIVILEERQEIEEIEEIEGGEKKTSSWLLVAEFRDDEDECELVQEMQLDGRVSHGFLSTLSNGNLICSSEVGSPGNYVLHELARSSICPTRFSLKDSHIS